MQKSSENIPIMKILDFANENENRKTMVALPSITPRQE